MKKVETSRRKFLGRSGSLALALPLAAAIPAAIEEVGSPTKVEAASADDIRQPIPNRALPKLAIGTYNYPVPNMPTDGSDCSKAINDAISYVVSQGGGTVFIPRLSTPLPNTKTPAQCVYMINSQANGDGVSVPFYGVMLQSKVRIECAPGVKLQAMPMNTYSSTLKDRAYMFYGPAPVSDVEIANCWIVGERYTHIYSSSTATDEHWYGISLLGATNVNIRATYVSDCTGDGICIGSLSGAAPSNITLCDVVSTGNRRQGLSIVSGNSISIYDSEFSYTAGTAPGDGIDIEPDSSADVVSNVTIDNCVIRGNAANGIEINASKGSVTGVNIVNCLIDYNSYAGFFAGNANTGTVYGNAFFQNGWYGIHMGGNTESYIVGGYSSGGYDSNSFANNGIHNSTSSPITYPNPTQTNTYGAVSGNDINITSTLPNTIQWNLYCTK